MRLLYALIASALVQETAFCDGKRDQLITVNISTVGNSVAFDRKEIAARFGAAIRIRFKNQAAVGSEILHNIAVLKPGTTKEVMSFYQATDYDNEKIRKHPAVLAYTPTLEPQRTAELRLTEKMLEKPGEYPYVCLLPGHADILGMRGILKVVRE